MTVDATARRLLRARTGHPVAELTFVRGQARLPELTVLMSIQYVETRRGAERIYWAEMHGLRRPTIIAAATRRMDDFDRPRLFTGATT